MQKNIQIILSITSILMASNIVFARGEHRLIWQNSESVIQDFKDVSKCTERIWPNYNWSDQTILSFSEKSKKQVAVNINTTDVFRVSLDDIPNGAQAKSTYSYFSANGKKWITVNENFSRWVPGPHSVFGLGAHEIFHFIAQKGWKYRAGSRGTNIPIRWEPRYYRAKMQYHLKQAFLNQENNIESLRKAKYWFENWSNQFPGEVNSATDGYEGTAEYAGVISLALALNGCRAAEEALHGYAFQEVLKNDQFADLLRYKGKIALDTEGYNVGAIASFILRWHMPTENWEERVANGETPVEILLENVTPLEESGDDQEIKGFVTSNDVQQKKVDQLLGSVLATLDSSSFYMVNIPQNWKEGSTSFKGFYVDTQRSLSYGVVAEDLSFQGQGGFINTKDGLVTIDSLSAPCSSLGWTFSVPNSNVEQNSNAFKFNGSLVRGVSQGSLKIGSSGQKWICVGE